MKKNIKVTVLKLCSITRKNLYYSKTNPKPGMSNTRIHFKEIKNYAENRYRTLDTILRYLWQAKRISAAAKETR